MRIVINGIGVAGPALAYWLSKSGHDVLLVEETPQLRTGGYIIDFWGVGFDIAERMGLIGDIRALGYQVREVRLGAAPSPRLMPCGLRRLYERHRDRRRLVRTPARATRYDDRPLP